MRKRFLLIRLQRYVESDTSTQTYEDILLLDSVPKSYTQLLRRFQNDLRGVVSNSRKTLEFQLSLKGSPHFSAPIFVGDPSFLEAHSWSKRKRKERLIGRISFESIHLTTIKP